jgi:hypothetical protein
MNYGCYFEMKFPQIKMNEEKSKTLKEIIDDRMKSNNEMFIILIDIFKRLEKLEAQSSTSI